MKQRIFTLHTAPNLLWTGKTAVDPDELRAFLNEIGDSIVVVDDDEIIKTHVDTNSPGDVLTEALKYGSLAHRED